MSEAQITELVNTAANYLPSCGPSGAAWRKACGVINGHGVQANIFGDAADKVVIWVDGSDESLTVEQAAQRVAPSTPGLHQSVISKVTGKVEQVGDSGPIVF